MSEISSTTNYNMFQKHPSNRDVLDNDLKNIINSIKSNNLLEFRPILVDKQYRVIDGQHRLAAARQLNVPIYYQVNNQAEHEDIILLNSAQKRWNVVDYVKYYISRGNKDYENLYQFCIQRDLSLIIGYNLIKNTSLKDSRSLRMGSLEFPKGEELVKLKKIADGLIQVRDILNRFILSNKSFIKSHKFLLSLSDFLKNPQVDLNVFITKMSFKVSAMHPCALREEYMKMLRDIYNWRNLHPID